MQTLCFVEREKSSRENSRELLLLGLVGGDHGEIDQDLIAVVDEVVSVTLGAIMAAVFGQRLTGVVIENFAATGEDVEHLAVGFVGVEAPGIGFPRMILQRESVRVRMATLFSPPRIWGTTVSCIDSKSISIIEISISFLVKNKKLSSSYCDGALPKEIASAIG